MSLKLAVLLCLCAIAVAFPKRVPRITGGTDVKPGQYPYYVALYYKYTLQSTYPISYGGGAILNDRWIITAAYNANAVRELDEILVQAGNIYYKKPSDTQQRSNVVARFVHPKYTEPNSAYDIALLKLETPFKFNDFVSTIDLPQSGVIPTGVGTVTGLGSLKHMMSLELPEIQQAVDLPIIDYETCDKLLDKHLGKIKEAINLLDESRYCTGPTETYQGYCLHDVGDPLVVNNTIVGVATFGFAADCEISDTPSIFTRVSAAIDWIQETISKN